MAWTETPSLSFTARHEASQSDDAVALLEVLEDHRARLEQLFPTLPLDVTVVLHDSPLQLALAQPYLPLARLSTAPAGRRYMTGWFARDEVHVLAPERLRALAAGPDSLKALMLSPLRAYTLLVVGCNSPLLPPPFRPATFRRYLELAWLAEGAAQHLSGQLPYLRAAIARRLRERRAPSLPPSRRDAALLGGSLFDLLERERGIQACVQLASVDTRTDGRGLLETAFARPRGELEQRWREHLARLAAPRTASPS